MSGRNIILPLNGYVAAVAVLAMIGCGNKADDRGAAKNTATTGSASSAAKDAAAAALIERGAYLVQASACAACHTGMGPNGPDVAHPFAGGIEMKEAFGTWRGPNITQDKATGIGSWTDDQIARAIREGIRPDNTRLFSIMPYMNYNGLSDHDIKSIVAFLRTVKPVERVVARTTELQMPKLEAPPPGSLADKPDDPIVHGKYLASIMLCGHCHWTPDEKMAPKSPEMAFSGGLPFEFPPGSGTILFARNITSDRETGIGAWTEDQVFTSLKTMTKPDGTQIRGPMLILQAGWSALEDRDLRAVAAYIKALPPVKNKVPDSTPPTAAAPAPAAPSKT